MLFVCIVIAIPDFYNLDQVAVREYVEQYPVRADAPSVSRHDVAQIHEIAGEWIVLHFRKRDIDVRANFRRKLF